MSDDKKAADRRAWERLDRFRRAIGLGPSRPAAEPDAAAPRSPAIPEIEQAIDSVPWALLAHAYHGAADAPEKLRAFVTAPSPEAAPTRWFWSSILHQGSLYSASAPAIWILSDLVKARPDHPCAPIILRAIQSVAAAYLEDQRWRREQGALDDEEPADGDSADDEPALTPLSVSAPGAPAWEAFVDAPIPSDADAPAPDAYFTAAQLRPALVLRVLENALPAARQSLRSPDPALVFAAVGAMVSLVEIFPDAPEAAADLRRVALSEASEPGARLSAVIALDALGEAVAPWLGHPDAPLRLGAAMAAGARALAESRDALSEALIAKAFLENAFPNGAAHLDMRLRFHVLRALLERLPPATERQDPLSEQALLFVLTRNANAYTADYELGPILAWAFAERFLPYAQRSKGAPAPLAPLSPAQRAILGAACASDGLWADRIGNRDNAFRAVGLPVERDALRTLVAPGGA